MRYEHGKVNVVIYICIMNVLHDVEFRKSERSEARRALLCCPQPELIHFNQ